MTRRQRRRASPAYCVYIIDLHDLGVGVAPTTRSEDRHWKNSLRRAHNEAAPMRRVVIVFTVNLLPVLIGGCGAESASPVCHALKGVLACGESYGQLHAGRYGR
jgi:hypothetical protein